MDRIPVGSASLIGEVSLDVFSGHGYRDIDFTFVATMLWDKCHLCGRVQA